MTGCRPHARLISITCPWRNGAELAGPVLSIGNAMGFDGLKCGMRYSSRAVSEDQAIEAAKQARPRNDRSELPRARTLGVPRGDRDPAAALGHFGDKAAKSSNRGTFPSCSCFHNLVRRSEEHTSELQSPCNLVCRLLLEKNEQHRADSQNQEGGVHIMLHTMQTRRCRPTAVSAGVRVRRNPGRARKNKRPLFFFNDTATTEIYTLSLHDALPI